MSSVASNKRRQFLSGLMKLLVFIGFVFLSIPFISSFSSNEIDEKQTALSNWVITVPIADLIEGEVKALSWSGGLVWVYTRTEKDRLSLKNNKVALRDGLSENSDQPKNMKGRYRSASEKFFVFIPQENKRNCQVRLHDSSETAVFTEPCFTASFDSAGRIHQNTGHKDQQNLAVPEHVIEEGVLKIGIWMPKIQ